MKRTPKSLTEIVNDVQRAEEVANRKADAIALITNAFSAVPASPTKEEQEQLVASGVVARRFDNFSFNPLKATK